jgi:hypothetical protein
MGQPARKVEPQSEQRTLARELLEIRAEHKDVFARLKELETALKAIATRDGKFRETFEALGYVSVSGEKPAESDGMHPVVDEQAFYALPKSRQDKLKEQGIIKEELRMKGPSYGRVTPQLF